MADKKDDKAPATDASAEQVQTPDTVEALTGAPEPPQQFAVIGEDGRRVKRGLLKPDAEAFADELSARTGEQLTVKPDDADEG